jgi:Flp pilus assembly protein TadB
MAQTKRKRRTKHRGNAAGVVEARGRTGRKPTSAEKSSKSRPDAAARREERLNRPPSWRSAFNRALIAAAILVVLSVVAFHFKASQMLVLIPFVLLIYVPLGYYTDLFMYRRRMRQKQRG